MAISVRSASQAIAATGTTSWTVPKPAGVVAGDLLVAFTVTGVGAHSDLTANEFTQTGPDSPTTQTTAPARVWLRVAGGSEPANYTFGRPTSQNNSPLGAIVALVGADVADPVDAAVSWGTGAAAASQVAPSISPSRTGSMLICGWRGGSLGSPSYTVPGSMVERADQFNGNYCQAMATELLAAATPTGTRTATATNTPLLSWHAFSIAIKEAQPGGAHRFMSFFT